LAEAGALVPARPDEGTIDEDVDQFRAFLDEVDPSEFKKHQGPGEPPHEGGP
jgi:hypothetical protein